MFSTFREAQNACNWHEAVGILKSQKIMNASSDSSLLRQNQNNYVQYHVGNKILKTRRIKFSPFNGVFQQNIPGVINNKINIYYAPSNPQNATVFKSADNRSFTIGFSLALFVIFIGLFSILKLKKLKIHTIKKNLTSIKHHKYLQKLNQFFISYLLLLLIELTPIFVCLMYSIDIQNDKYHFFSMVNMFAVLWLFLCISVSFFIIQELFNKQKKSKKIRFTVQKCLDNYRSEMFVIHTIISTTIWTEWLITQL